MNKINLVELLNDKEVTKVYLELGRKPAIYKNNTNKLEEINAEPLTKEEFLSAIRVLEERYAFKVQKNDLRIEKETLVNKQREYMLVFTNKYVLTPCCLVEKRKN